MASAFERLSTETQGRLAPIFAPPVLGEHLFVLGSDAPGDVQRLALGDQVVLEQACDVTGLKLVRFRARLRPPAALPAVGYDLDQVGAVPEVPVAPRWLFKWGVGAAVHGVRELRPGRVLAVNDGAIDVSQLSGTQTLRFYLQLAAS